MNGDRDPLAESARIAGDEPALVSLEPMSAWTYRELHDRVEDLAGGLVAAGIRAQDRVGILGSNEPAVIETIHACWRIGAVPVPMDPGLGAERTRDRRERVELATILASQDIETLPAGVETIGGLRASARPPEADERGEAHHAAILFTSGTTGEPEAVALSWENVRTSAVASAFRLGLSRTDRWGLCLPPYHMGGFAPIIRSAIYGTAVVLHPPAPSAIARAIRSAGLTGVSLVPPLLRRSLDEDAPLAALRAVLVGGDRTPPALVRRALEAGVPLFCSYGMTETSSQIATATPTQLGEDPDAVGQPLRWMDVEIRAGDGRTRSPGESGEIVVSGPAVIEAYLGDARPGRFTDDGALRTGDVGHLDRRGRLSVTGRADTRIVTGGATIDPQAVASVLRAHDAVADAVVVGLPDEAWGERVGALLVTEGDTCGEAIVEELADRLGSQERPRAVRVVDALPRTASGTVDRRAARRQLEEGRRD